jgi:hypothetical protein
MNHSYSLTVIAAAAFVFFTNGAESSPHQTPGYSPLPLEAGLRCGLVNGQVVCGDKKNSNKHHDDDDGHDKGKKKKTDDDDASGLTECTIQGTNSGGGCKSGFKYVCEKMKSGKKCCGCVPDKSQGTSAGKATPPADANTGQKDACSDPNNVLWGDYCYTKQQQ